MSDWQADRIGSALRGENPTVMARLPGGFAVIGDVQWLPGYCVLLADDPAVTRLTDLPRPRYDWEPADVVGKPVWLYPVERWSAPEHRLGPEHGPLRAAIRKNLLPT
jgi:hypothetical protein